jgi:NAD(P)-dependent dehydrogenase (short-subunit alcohol dehydrogenase family)
MVLASNKGVAPLALPDSFNMSGRTFLVTGASSGIGREVAVTLSELGARVILTARRGEELAATRMQMKGDGHAVEPFDLTNLHAIADWVKSLATRHSSLSGLVHAAGINSTVPLRSLSVELLSQTFRVNFDSAVMLVKGMRQRGCCHHPASVVLVSSVTAFVGRPAIAAYAASKAALIGLSKSLSIELATEGIRVNCIAPGIVETEMTDEIRRALSAEQFDRLSAQHPLGLGTPRDVAWASAYLLSDASRWVTGTTLVVDGGYSAQ